MSDEMKLAGILYIGLAIISVTLHGFVQAGIAAKLGDNSDDTKKFITLNPLTHLDLIGTFVFPFFVHFGWSRQIPADFSSTSKPNRNNLYFMLSGLYIYFVLSIVVLLILKILGLSSIDRNILYLFGELNFLMFAFNILPIPPLDGGRFYLFFMKGKLQNYYQDLYSFGIFILLLMLVIPRFDPGIPHYLKQLYIKSFKYFYKGMFELNLFHVILINIINFVILILIYKFFFQQKKNDKIEHPIFKFVNRIFNS